MPELLRCDFCSGIFTELAKDYHAEKGITAILGSLTYIDDGVWGACAECAELIDADKFEELIERGVVGTMARWRFGADVPNLRQNLRFTLRGIFGERVRL